MADLLKQWGFSNGYHYPSSADAALSVGIGAPWWRCDVNWLDVEATQGTYNWSVPDGFVSTVNAAGARAMFCMYNAPSWASSLPSANLHKYPNAAHYTNWANWCAAVVTRYAPQGVTHYEIWNEANMNGFWGQTNPDPATYTALLKAAYPAMKNAAAAVGRSIVVVSVGCAPVGGYTDAQFQVGNSTVNQTVFVEKMYQSGAAGFFDALGYHPYATENATPLAFNYQSAWSQIEDTTVSLRSLMTQYGDAAKLIHATESGARSVNVNQSNWITTVTAAWASKSYTGIYAYYLFREGDNGGDATFQSYGLRTSANVAKAGWTTYASQIAALGTGGSVGGGGGGGGGGSGANTLVQAIGALGPKSLWKLGETSSTFADTSGANSFPLTLTGSATRGTAALSGDASDKSVTLSGGTLGAGDQYRFAGSASYSLVALVDPTTLTASTFYGIFGKWASSDGYMVWLNNNAGAFRLAHERDSSTLSQAAVLTTATIAVGAKLLVTATFDGTNIKSYINNELASAPGSAVVAGSTAGFTVGGGGNTTAFAGVIDVAAVFDYALTAAQIAALVSAIPVAPSTGGGGAAQFVRELASGLTAGGGTTTFTITLTAGATGGDFVVMYLGGKWITASAISVADSRGNTWSLDNSVLNDGQNNSALIASTAQDRGTFQTGDTITVTVTGGTFATGIGQAFYVEEFSGILASPLDQTSSSTAFPVSSKSTGTTGTTVQADEVAVAGVIVGVVEATLTPGSFTAFPGSPDFGSSRSAGAGYKILTSAGTQSETFSWTTTADSATAMIATYKANPSSAPPAASEPSLTLLGC